MFLNVWKERIEDWRMGKQIVVYEELEFGGRMNVDIVGRLERERDSTARGVAQDLARRSRVLANITSHS